MISLSANLTVIPAPSPVVLLVHCDGTNGSTTFIDKSPSAHPLTPTSVTVATGNPKFGTGSASLTFSNLAASISVGGNASDFWFDSGPFTMEAWCYATQAPGWDGYSILFAEWGGALSNLGFWFSAFPTIMFFWSFDGVNYDYVDAGVGCPLNAWTHIAADRDASGTLRVYLNGAVVASRSIPGSFFHSTFTCQVGNDNTLSRPFPGYLDEIRVTKGVAVYGGAFTPPTAAFPDPGAGAGAGSQYGMGPYGQGLYSRYTPQIQNFAGNLAPAVTFGGAFVATENLAGNLAPSAAFAGGLSRIAVVTGNLAPSLAFAGGLTVTPATELAGNLAPHVVFGPSQLTTPQPIFGDLAPVVTFAANVSVIYAVTGGLAPQTALGATLTGVWDLAGDMAAGVDLAASGRIWAVLGGFRSVSAAGVDRIGGVSAAAVDANRAAKLGGNWR